MSHPENTENMPSISPDCKMAPLKVDVEEGRLYAWCTCGYSQKQPFCDGSHRGKTELKSLKWIAPKTGPIYFCGCKKTKSQPFCDGSHSK